jgi:hypothetical protein
MDDRKRARRSDLITVSGGHESPSAGRWTIPAASVIATVGTRRVHRRRVTELSGFLDVADESLAKTLVLYSVSPGATCSTPFCFRGRLIGENRLGVWRFDGTATEAGVTYGLEITVIYRGVYVNGASPVCWLSLGGARVTPRSVGHRGRVVRSLRGELSALGLSFASRPRAPIARAS